TQPWLNSPSTQPASSSEKKSSVNVQLSGAIHAGAITESAGQAPASLTAALQVPSASQTPAASAPVAPSPVKMDSSSDLPRPHQMLDAPVPAAPMPATALPAFTSATGDGQIHVGLRTDAFGAVEIHTVVQQSQVGVTVHGEHDIARWFSSEVANLE